MATTSEVLRAALTRLANDRRRTITHYANVAPRPGNNSVPTRLLSDVGFLSGTQFTYVNAHLAHVTPPEDQDIARTVTQLVIVPYGTGLDATRLNSTRAVDRLVRTRRGVEQTGVAPLVDTPEVLVSAELDEGTVSKQKTRQVLQGMTQRRPGPAYHVLVDRAGNVTIGPSLDVRTNVVQARMETAVFIGVEGALGVLRSAHEGHTPNALFELPLTPVQLVSLSIVLAKLAPVYPTIPQKIDNTAYVYVAPAESPRLNFSNGAWKGLNNGSPFDYGVTDDEELFALVAEQGTFDFATDIYRPPTSPRPVAARAEVQATIGTTDTAGAQSLYLGAYVDLAAPERAFDIEAQTRRQLFVQRIRVAHTEADDAGSTASDVETGTGSVTPIKPTVINAGPHVYNYKTGRWGDGGTY